MKSEGIKQFIKFGIVGVSNTAVDWIVYFIFSHYIFTGTQGELVSKAISFVVAVTNSFIWNSAWTFKKEYKKAVSSKEDRTVSNGRLFAKFLVVSLIGWGVNYYTFKYTRISLAQGQVIALVAASGMATLWNFFGNKLWTYKK